MAGLPYARAMATAFFFLRVDRGVGANGNSAANTGRRSIVITAGDCLWNHFGADSARVAAANGISNPNLVRAGTVIHY